MKAQFPLLAAHPELIYLDNAATVQKPQYVIDEVTNFLTHEYANIHRGTYPLALAAEAQWDRARACISQVLSCREEEVVFTHNATHASNLLAWSMWYSGWIQEGDIILLGITEHHATIAPRQQVAERSGATIVYIGLDETSRQYDWSIIDTIDPKKIKVVALSLVSNVLGQHADLSFVKELSKKYQFFTIVDIAQAVPHFLIDVQELGADFVFFTGHKLGALTGIGVLRGKQEYLERLSPLGSGGGAVDQVGLHSHTLQASPDKFEAGTPNVVGAVSLRAAYEWIAGTPSTSDDFTHLLHNRFTEIVQHEYELQQVCCTYLQGLQDDGYIRVFGSLRPDNRIGLFSRTMENHASHTLGRRLGERDICVRTGLHCAHPLHTRRDMIPTVRMSLWAYNTLAEVMKSFAAIEQFCRGTS